MTPATRSETFPKLKTREKLSLDVRRVAALPSCTVPPRLFSALFGAMMNKSPPHIRFESARRARTPPTLLNSFLYYVFSESECNLPAVCPPLGLPAFREPEERGFPSTRQVINTPPNKLPRPFDIARALARCDDLITITYKNVQHVDPSPLLLVQPGTRYSSVASLPPINGNLRRPDIGISSNYTRA